MTVLGAGLMGEDHMISVHFNRFIGLAVVAGFLAFQSDEAMAAKAKPKAPTEVEQMVERAAAELSAGHAPAAVELYTKALRLQPSVNAARGLARSLAASGQMLESLKVLREVAGKDPARPTLPASLSAEERRQVLADIDLLEIRLPRVELTVSGPPPARVVVEIKGKSYDYGIPIRLDPGSYELQVKAPGFTPKTEKIAPEEGARLQLKISLSQIGGSDFRSEPQVSEASSWQGPVAYGSIALAAVGVGLGTVFLLQRGSKSSDSNQVFEECTPRGCTSGEKLVVSKLDAEANRAGNMAIGSFVVAGLAGALGATLLVWESKTKADLAQSPKSQVLLLATPSSATVFGRF